MRFPEQLRLASFEALKQALSSAPVLRRVRIHVSVFVTSQVKKIALSLRWSRSTGLGAGIYDGHFLLPNPNTDSKPEWHAKLLALK